MKQVPMDFSALLELAKAKTATLKKEEELHTLNQLIKSNGEYVVDTSYQSLQYMAFENVFIMIHLYYNEDGVLDSDVNIMVGEYDVNQRLFDLRDDMRVDYNNSLYATNIKVRI